MFKGNTKMLILGTGNPILRIARSWGLLFHIHQNEGMQTGA